MMVCLLRTAWSDPGIIPRASPEEAAFVEKYAQSKGNGFKFFFCGTAGIIAGYKLKHSIHNI